MSPTPDPKSISALIARCRRSRKEAERLVTKVRTLIGVMQENRLLSEKLRDELSARRFSNAQDREAS